MAHLLIDGYNLIGISHSNLQQAREEIIKDLSLYSKIKDHDITLVFDGWQSGNMDESRTRSAGLTVIYSRHGEKADDLIKRLIANTTVHWIIISSDREIYDFAVSKDHAAIRSDEFETYLYNAIDQNDGNTMSDNFIVYSEIEHTGRKVNPRKVSRKQKKKLQALKKL